MKLTMVALLFAGAAGAQQPLTRDGPALFRMFCASCHGMDGKGGGPVAVALKKPPPDLTRISARNDGKFPLERVNRAISGKELGPTAHGSREMPIWGPIFSQVENDQDAGPVRVDNVARYLKQIQSR